MKSEAGKVYLNILKEINQIMSHDQLSAGDKLPSERELAERLQVGRSSVREALRALELLDLIETRKGEGTFIQEAGSHRLAEILASFFLKDEKARQDVTETRRIIEIEAVRLGCQRAEKDQLDKLQMLIYEARDKWSEGEIPVDEDYLFHKTLVQSSQNILLYNIWRPLVEYAKIALKDSLGREGRTGFSIKEHEIIYEALLAGEEEKAVSALKHHLENSRF
ncbi:FadR/GntR family transcriptional regulator [Salipaludibacillus aurantiacus]|uniref:GntR family transcriptional regulator, transcriptional repressor for pyruvate dehydrogenase complex n=1 Tax=Salipaludibacillus aurantiacus TaxID=1601833 RepID=A0A1H9SX62_9BACI|nr:FadR/GntR family transcriptional regulator [Salipaludibacillus aurantiacus]SER89495.1 GntR family transcriptional regulator, transcriptional repressor for pyruvate dehydrogenase complex [Salipaludibacillus aurantiacus]